MIANFQNSVIAEFRYGFCFGIVIFKITCVIKVSFKTFKYSFNITWRPIRLVSVHDYSIESVFFF